MKVNMTVKRRIVFNGKEYDSIEELPESVRRTLENATAGSLPSAATGATAGAKVRIMFNGQEYASVDAMPASVRRIYEGALAAVESDGAAGQIGAAIRVASMAGGTEATSAGGIAVSATPIEPGAARPLPWRLILTIAALVAFILLNFYLVTHRHGFH
jgi:hypothetical protein